MTYPKMGLVLGGGGGKGSYQVGVYQALLEHGYVDHIQAISGNSIGSLNLTIFATKDLNTAKEIWGSLSRKSVLTLKPWKEYLNWKDFSLFSRDGLVRIFKNHIDLQQISESPIPLYVATSNETDNQGEVFLLNHQPADRITKILFASTAIPKAFDNVEIDGKTYYDGYKYNNVPIDCVIKEGCKIIFVIPLGELHAPKEGDYPDVILIDFKDPNFVDIGHWEGTFGFDKELALERIAKGYEYANKLLCQLEQEGVIAPTRRGMWKCSLRRIFHKAPPLRNYYSLKEIGIVYDKRMSAEALKENKSAPEKVR